MGDRLYIINVKLNSAFFRVKGLSPVVAIAFLTGDGLIARSTLTVSEVAADWHELMIPQRTMKPSISPR